ncbi:MAG: winged helix-turn-helix domain-containing protein [Halobacteria archaeon]|nr:winged helix-turn-helix domain-containing protein [Halobacteria archaeon]
MSLLETEVRVENVITTDLKKAGALENDIRAKILDMLTDEEMTVEEIREELNRRGEDKAETTVRHHVNVLKDAGMIELARLEEQGGATLKYYKSNTRVFSYELPDKADEQLSEAYETTRNALSDLTKKLIEEHGDDIKDVAKEMKPCEYCETQHYEEYLIRELLNRALIDLSENGEFDDILH